MKKTKLSIVAASAAALLAFTLSGCTSSGSGTSGVSGTSGTSHLKQVLQSKTIKIAVSPSTPGWGEKTASGKYEGYDIDIANALAESLGAKVQFINATDASRIPLLQTNKADVVIATLTAKNERAQQIDMSIPYASNSDAIVVPSGSAIKKYSDLDGKDVAAVTGSAGESLLQENFPKAKEVAFSNIADAVQAIKSKKVDALMEDLTVDEDLIRSSSNAYRIVDGPSLGIATYSFGVKQGDQTWLNYVNNFIRNYNIGGTGQDEYQKWFHLDMPDYLK